MTKHILTTSILLLTTFTYTAAQYRTDGFKDFKPNQTLEGLRDIELIVQYGQADGLQSEKQAIVLEALQARTVELLKQGQVPFLQSKDQAKLVGRPRLVLTVTVRKVSDPPPGVRIECNLFQRVRLWRDMSQELELVTWHAGAKGPQVEVKGLSTLLDRVVNSFVSNYRAANQNPLQADNRTTDSSQVEGKGNALHGLRGIDFAVSPGFIVYIGNDGNISDDNRERLKAVSKAFEDEAVERLKKAGIPVLRYAKDTAPLGYPLLDMVVRFSAPSYYDPAIDVKSSLWQRVRRVSDLQRHTYIRTWELHSEDGPTISEDTLVRMLNNQLDEFIKAYKAANTNVSTTSKVQ